MLTELGKFLRKLRLDVDELLGDMAAKLDVSSSMLSAVETGRKNMPKNWESHIPNIYNFNTEETQKFKELVKRSANKISIDIKQTKTPHRSLAFEFAREFRNLTDDEVAEMRKIFSNAKNTSI